MRTTKTFAAIFTAFAGTLGLLGATAALSTDMASASRTVWGDPANIVAQSYGDYIPYTVFGDPDGLTASNSRRAATTPAVDELVTGSIIAESYGDYIPYTLFGDPDGLTASNPR